MFIFNMDKKCNYLQKGIPDTCSWLSIFMGRFLLNSAEVEQNLCLQKNILMKLSCYYRNFSFCLYLFDESSFFHLSKSSNLHVWCCLCGFVWHYIVFSLPLTCINIYGWRWRSKGCFITFRGNSCKMSKIATIYLRNISNQGKSWHFSPFKKFCILQLCDEVKHTDAISKPGVSEKQPRHCSTENWQIKSYLTSTKVTLPSKPIKKCGLLQIFRNISYFHPIKIFSVWL